MNLNHEHNSSICSVCHNEPVNAVGLDCGHIFCYLCVKSVSETTGVCPLCRKIIDIKFNFQNHSIVGSTRVPSSESGYFWFYEGFKGWWLYDAETNRDLENAINSGQQTVTKFIAGHIYLIDLQSMTQRRKEGNDNRARKVIRSKIEDLNNILGMSGLRTDDFNDILDMMKCSASLKL